MTGTSDNAVTIEIIAGPHMGIRRRYDSYATCLIGRGPEAHLCLDQDPHFSRRHLLIEISPPNCRVVDLRSQNGTFLNGTLIQTSDFRPGDLIECGLTQIRVSVGGMSDAQRCDETLPLPPKTPVAGKSTASRNPNGDESAGPTLIAPGGAPPVIAGYEIQELIGTGSMGAVYRAIEKLTRRICALKVIIPERVIDDDSVKLFLREASVLSKLEHTRILKFFELGWDGGHFFISTELIPTVTFESVVESRSAGNRIRISSAVMCEVLDALDYAHSKSIVHRDVKPSNLLLYNAGRKLKVKLADFGLAKNYLNAGISGITDEGQTRGTLAFSAPEQLVDSLHARPACDIFAVAATLYYLLTGEYPYDFPNGVVPLGVVLTGDVVPLQSRNSDVPADLCSIVERAMHPDPGRRFSNCREMREWLLPFAKRR